MAELIVFLQGEPLRESVQHVHLEPQAMSVLMEHVSLLTKTHVQRVHQVLLDLSVKLVIVIQPKDRFAQTGNHKTQTEHVLNHQMIVLPIQAYVREIRLVLVGCVLTQRGQIVLQQLLLMCVFLDGGGMPKPGCVVKVWVVMKDNHFALTVENGVQLE